MNTNKAPIWRDAQPLLALVEEAVRRFPCYHKYTLGSDLWRQALHICRLVNQAWRDQQGRLRHIEHVVMAVDEFKLLLQVGKEVRGFAGFGQFQHLVERLRAALQILWRNERNGCTLDLRRKPRDRLRASLASYVGHGCHAAAWRLFRRMFQRHAWLRVLLTMHDGLRLQPRWLPSAATSLRGQWRWFVREWPGLAVLVQTGHRFELYDDQARSLAQWLTSALDPVPRQSFVATLSAPLTRLQGFRRELRRGGFSHLFLAEEGFLPGGLKRRVLRLAWWPEHPQPGLLPDNPGDST